MRFRDGNLHKSGNDCINRSLRDSGSRRLEDRRIRFGQNGGRLRDDFRRASQPK